MAISNKYEATEEDIEFIDSIVPESPEERVSWYRSIISAPLKGASKGAENIYRLGRLFIPEGKKEGPQSAFEAFTPTPPYRDPAEREDAELKLQGLVEEYLPTREEGAIGAISGGLERAGRIATEMASLGTPLGAAVGRGALGGITGEGTKQLGGGELAQNIAEIGGTIGPDLAKAIPNMILPTAAAREQQVLKEFARSQGLTEAELNLAIGEKGTQQFLSDVATKGGQTVKAFDSTKQALGRVWNTLREAPNAAAPMNEKITSKLINNMSKKLSKLPAEQRERIMTDFNDFLGSQMKGSDAIDLWQKLNYYINKGERGLGILKDDIQKALTSHSSELGKDFQLTNKLYGNFSDLAGRMAPDIAEKLISTGEKGLIVHAITSGNFPILKRIIGPIAGRKLAQQMIVNPRLKNLSARFINGISRGSPTIAQRTYDQILIEIGKVSPEAAKEMAGIDFEEFFNTDK